MNETSASQVAAPEAAPEAAPPPPPPSKEFTVQSASFTESFVQVSLASGLTKNLSWADFVKIMMEVNGSIQSAPLRSSPFLLPPNTYYFNPQDGVIDLNVYHPSAVKKCTFYGKDYQCRVPNIVLSFTLKFDIKTGKGGVNSVKYWCTDKPAGNMPVGPITNHNHKQGIYLLSMPNVYERADLCFGQNVMPSQVINFDLRGLHWYYDVMWNSPFNNDLGVPGLKNNRDVETWLKLLAQKATDNQPFPYEMLRGHPVADPS